MKNYLVAAATLVASHIKSCWTYTSLILAGYIALDVTRSLLYESIYFYSPNKLLPLDPALMIFTAEVCKFLVALVIVCFTTQTFTFKGMHLFLIQTGLYYVNNLLYFNAVSLSSAPTASFLLHLRLPITAFLHHLFITNQTSSLLWPSITAVCSGVMISQLNESMNFSNVRVIVVCTVIALFSSIASILNEKMLKKFNMPFWDQQLRLYLLGSLYSGLNLVLSNQTMADVELMNFENMLASLLCIFSIITSGLLTGLLVYRLDSVVKLVSQAGVTILLAILTYIFFGKFEFIPANFTFGSVILTIGLVLYAFAIQTKPNHKFLDSN